MNTNGIGNVSATTPITVVSQKKNSQYGKTVGTPELSEKAAKYYESLKEKFSDMDFVLVSDDMKDQAEANASAYANPYKTVVLINESKIEEMAEDENVRDKYEALLLNAKNQLSQISQAANSSGLPVAGYGITIDDNGNAKYFAVLEKSSEAQKARIEKHLEEVRAEKKEEAKEASKEKFEERLEKLKTSDTVTLSADSVEELLQKISDYTYEYKADTVQTDAEKLVGQNFDFRG